MAVTDGTARTVSPQPLHFAYRLSEDDETLRPGQALSYRQWRGGRLRAGPNAQPEEPHGTLTLCDFGSADDTASLGSDWWIGEQILPGRKISPDNAGALLMNVMSIDSAHEEEFNDWYDTEHMAQIAMVPGVLCARRFRALRGDPGYAAVYHLADLDVTRTAEWRDAATSPWTTRIQTLRFDSRRLGFLPLGQEDR